MMKRFINWVVLSVIVLLPLNAQEGAPKGIKFFKGTFDEALVEAQNQNKVIFVDFYAVWCGPCKRMAKTIFTQDSIGRYFNENFINLQLDAEKPENVEIAKRYNVEAFPTLAFIGKDGKALSVSVGALGAKELMECARTATGEIIDFKQLYELHRQDPDNLKLQQDMLLKAPRFLMAQDGMDAERWVVRIRKLYRSYIEKKKGPSLINKEDYIIISELGGEDKKEKEEMVDFINSNLTEWMKAVGNAPVYYVIEYNDGMIEDLAKEGNDNYKKYLEKIKNEYQTAYSIISMSGDVTPYETTKKYAEAIFFVYKNKDVKTYTKLMNDYFSVLGSNVTSQDYGKAAQNLYYAAAQKMNLEDHKLAIQWLEKALSGDNPAIDRINYLVMIGDSYREMKEYDNAQKFYNQGYAESLQLGNAESAQQMIQASIFRKLATLDLLRK